MWNGDFAGCRKLWKQSDCAPSQIFLNAQEGCRELVASDCSGQTPLYVAQKISADEKVISPPHCRAFYTQKDCTGDTPIVNSSRNGCRAYVEDDCSGSTPVFLSGAEGCRAVYTKEECAATNKPVLDSPMTGCREYSMEDCTGDTPVFRSPTDGCRGLFTEAECAATQTTPLLEDPLIGCRAYTQEDCKGKHSSVRLWSKRLPSLRRG